MKRLAKYAKRTDNFTQVAFALERGRLVSVTIPRDITNKEVERVWSTLAEEVAFDRVLLKKAVSLTAEQREAVN